MVTNRRLVPMIVRSGCLAIAFMGCASTHASQADGTMPSAAHFAAIADDICIGMPAKERQIGLLAYREDIERVAPLLDEGPYGQIQDTNKGAVVRLRATPGMSIPWLERVNRCHVALVGSGRLVDKESAEDPFLVPGASVWAGEVYGGYYNVSIESADRAMAMEILRRSKALLSAPPHLPTASLDSR
jgi:hypothetical protein